MLETLSIHKDASQNRLQLLVWNTFIFLNKDDIIAWIWSSQTEEDTILSVWYLIPIQLLAQAV